MITRACKCGAKIPLHEQCPTCNRAKRQQCDRYRGSAASRGYDRDWREVRIEVFRRDGWRCVDCQWQPGVIEQWQRAGLPGLPHEDDILEELRKRALAGDVHLHGDHLEPVADRPDLRLDVSNVATRCSSCHDKRTAREHGFQVRAVKTTIAQMVQDIRDFQR